MINNILHFSLFILHFSLLLVLNRCKVKRYTYLFSFGFQSVDDRLDEGNTVYGVEFGIFEFAFAGNEDLFTANGQW